MRGIDDIRIKYQEWIDAKPKYPRNKGYELYWEDVGVIFAEIDRLTARLKEAEAVIVDIEERQFGCEYEGKREYRLKTIGEIIHQYKETKMGNTKLQKKGSKS